MHVLRHLSWQLLLTCFAGLSAQEFGFRNYSFGYPGNSYRYPGNSSRYPGNSYRYPGNSSRYPGNSSGYPGPCSPLDDLLGNVFPANQIPAFMRVLPESFLKRTCLSKNTGPLHTLLGFNSYEEFSENLQKCIHDPSNGDLNKLVHGDFEDFLFTASLLPSSWTKDLPTAQVCVNTQELITCILPQSFGNQCNRSCNFNAGLKQLLKELRDVPCTNGGGGESITNFARNAFVGFQCLFTALYDSDFETCLDIQKYNVAKSDTACSFLKTVGSCAQNSFICPANGKQGILATVNVFQELICSGSTAVVGLTQPLIFKLILLPLPLLASLSLY